MGFSVLAFMKNKYRNRQDAEQCRGYGKGRAPLTAGYAPHFGLLKIPFLKHHVTTRQSTMMAKGKITFKHT